MKTIKTIITALSLCLIVQTTYAQNCRGNKVLMSKGWKGACGCRCQSHCVDQSEVQNYINMGWYLGECINIGKLCCGGWIRSSQEQSISETMLTGIHPDADSRAVAISFNLSKQSEVNLQVFDMTGRCVATVANTVFKEKGNEVTWDASGVKTGMYFLKMKAGSYCVTQKIPVIN